MDKELIKSIHSILSTTKIALIILVIINFLIASSIFLNNRSHETRIRWIEKHHSEHLHWHELEALKRR